MVERFLQPIYALGVYHSARIRLVIVSDLLLGWETVFGVTYELRVKYKIGRMNRYLEGRNG